MLFEVSKLQNVRSERIDFHFYAIFFCSEKNLTLNDQCQRIKKIIKSFILWSVLILIYLLPITGSIPKLEIIATIPPWEVSGLKNGDIVFNFIQPRKIPFFSSHGGKLIDFHVADNLTVSDLNNEISKITQCPNKFQFHLINGEIPPGKTVLKNLNFPSYNKIETNCQIPQCRNNDLPEISEKNKNANLTQKLNAVNIELALSLIHI